MTDRELLERAAKAAGRRIHWSGNVAVLDDFQPGTDQCSAWNPLADDGDALRLAVKLRLNVNFEEWDGAEYACAIPHNSHQGCDEVLGDDHMAATRRAIVRAAAEMAQ